MNSSLQDYEVLNIVGSGSFGTCYKVRNILNDRTFVWKAVDYGKLSEEKKKLLCNEVNCLSEVSHPFIVKYYSRILNKETTTLYIIMEWCQGGDLSSVIKETNKVGKLIEEWYIWRVVYQLGRALEHLHHEHSLVHRDVKAANVFLDSKGNIKLGDLGLSCFATVNSPSPQSITVGTLYYLSPESLKGAKYSFKSDIWSLGCLIYELCSLTPPFHGVSMAQLMSNIKIGRFQRIPANYSENLSKVVNLMLTVPIDLRPSARVITHHPTVVANQTGGSADFSSGGSLSKKSDGSSEWDDLGKRMGSFKINEDGPENVSKKIFKDKWLAKLESVRSREARLREKTEKLEEREHSLNRREKQLNILERKAKDKITRAQVYLNRCKDSKQSILRERQDEMDASYSADTGDTSILPTVAKINPLTLAKPNFPDFKKTKHVHFQQESPKLQTNATRLSYFQVSKAGDENLEETTIKGLRYSSCEVYKTGKENRPIKDNLKRSSASRLSIRSSNIFI